MQGAVAAAGQGDGGTLDGRAVASAQLAADVHRPVHHLQQPAEGAGRRRRPRLQRAVQEQRVRDAQGAGARRELGDEDGRPGQVVLAAAAQVPDGQVPAPTAVGVEQEAKTAGESKRGRQAQAMRASRPTSAAVSPSPTRAWSAMGG